MNSYSLYSEEANMFYNQVIDENASEMIAGALSLLQDENRLQEIVKLVGFDSLSDMDKLKLEFSKSIREDYLQQFAFHTVDSHSPLQKQFNILKLILVFYSESYELIEKEIVKFREYYEQTKSVREKIARVKFIPEGDTEAVDNILRDMLKVIETIKLMSVAHNKRG